MMDAMQRLSVAAEKLASEARFVSVSPWADPEPERLASATAAFAEDVKHIADEYINRQMRQLVDEAVRGHFGVKDGQ